MNRNAKINTVLLLLVAALAVLPLALGLGDHKREPFTGSDAEAETAITEIEPSYEPWFSPLYEPPSGEIESALFALQAALGAGVLAYYFGIHRGRRQGEARARAQLDGADGTGTVPTAPVSATATAASRASAATPAATGAAVSPTASGSTDTSPSTGTSASTAGSSATATSAAPTASASTATKTEPGEERPSGGPAGAPRRAGLTLVLPIDAAAHSSRWRRRHPVDKAVLGLGLTLLAISLPPWPGAALVLLTALVVLLGPAGVPGRRLWRAYRVPLGFCVTGALPLLVQVGGPGGFVTPADGGPVRAGELLLRTSAASLGVLLFAFTTPMSDLLPRLVKAGVPAPVVDVALVTYRMSFLLLDSVRRIREAQAARLGHTTRAATWRSLAGLGATAFVRAFDRAARLQTGLAGRGYDGTLRVLVPEARVSVRFVGAGVALLATVTALTFVLERPLT